MAPQNQNKAIESKPVVSAWGIPIVVGVDENKVYPSKFGAGRSTTVAVVTLPIAAVGMRFTATIYGRLEEKPEGTSITFEPSFGKGVKGATPDDTKAAKALALDAAMAWAGWNAAEKSAIDALTADPAAPKVKAANGETAKPTSVVRLVKKVAVAQSDAAPAA